MQTKIWNFGESKVKYSEEVSPFNANPTGSRAPRAVITVTVINGKINPSILKQATNKVVGITVVLTEGRIAKININTTLRVKFRKDALDLVSALEEAYNEVLAKRLEQEHRLERQSRAAAIQASGPLNTRAYA